MPFGKLVYTGQCDIPYSNSNACNAFRETGLYRSVWHSIQITVTLVGKCDSNAGNAFQGTGLYR